MKLHSKAQRWGSQMSQFTSQIEDMMAELDAIAAERGIKWGPAEIGTLNQTEREPLPGGGNSNGGSPNPASPKQLALLGWLPQRKGQPALTEEQLRKLSSKSASAMIDKLSGMKDAVASAPVYDVKRQMLDYWLPFIHTLADDEDAQYQWTTWCYQRDGRNHDPEQMMDADWRDAESFSIKLNLPGASFVSAAKGVGEDVAAEAYRAADKRKVESAGMFRNPFNGDVYKVQKAVHGSGHLYAKKLETIGEGADAEGAFVMAKGAIFQLRESWRMTLAEAEEYGLLYGVCCVCSATLTDETSIARGIGPVCAGKAGYWA